MIQPGQTRVLHPVECIVLRGANNGSDNGGLGTVPGAFHDFRLLRLRAGVASELKQDEGFADQVRADRINAAAGSRQGFRQPGSQDIGGLAGGPTHGRTFVLDQGDGFGATATAL